MCPEFQLKIRYANPEGLHSAEPMGAAAHQAICPTEIKSPHNLAWRFLDSCCRHSQSVALSKPTKSLTYEWLKTKSIALSQLLRNESRFRRGIHIGLNFENSIEYVVAFYGTILAGGVVVPIPVGNSRTQRQQLCKLGKVEVLLTSEECGNVFDTDLLPNGTRGFRREYASPDCLAMLMFTSGSTGCPKAVMLTHRNLTSNCDSILDFMPVDQGDRTLAISPLTHALGNSVMQTHILSGGELYFASSQSGPMDVLRLISESNCDSMTGVPDVLINLSRSLDGRQLPNLKYLACAGGRLPSETALQLNRQIGDAKLYLMYGQTEATARLAWLPPEDLAEQVSTIGRPVRGVQLKIVDENGDAVGDNVVGNLVATGPNITRGYFNDPQGTSKILADGWLNTGDLARQNSDGFIEICGRRNGLVKILGHRFHPLEVEKLVGSYLNDTQIVVTSFDFYGNTRIALFAKCDENQQLTESELKSICRKLLPQYMMPQRIQVVDNWPLNHSGKVNRSRLASNFETAKTT